MGRIKRILLIICLCLFSASALFFSIKYLNNRITVSVLGNQEITIELGETYDEQGALAYKGKTLVSDINISGGVDTNTPGVYKITYWVKDSNKTVKAIRTVRVVDSVCPVITAPSELKIFIGTDIKKAVFECKAVDNFDGDITSRILTNYQEDSIRLSVTDTSGNKTTHTIIVKRVTDTVPPVLTLKGSSTVFLKLDAAYNDLGFTAIDNVDGDITQKVVVDGLDELQFTGDHILTYSVEDSSGNTATAKRTVVVYKASGIPPSQTDSNRVIYLTFDDGPCVYTPQILSILARYNVKATFFVTNQIPGYQNYIGEAYRQGHAIAAHTYSHRYSIYQSPETYFADLDAINEIIKAQTGSYTRLIRFPGGSSNTVSKNYAVGIMSYLTQEVTNRGYIYFDWNIISGDADSSARRNDPNFIISNVTRNLRNGANVVLMHDINPTNITALPVIIEYCYANGYTFLPLDENSPTMHLTVKN